MRGTRRTTGPKCVDQASPLGDLDNRAAVPFEPQQRVLAGARSPGAPQPPHASERGRSLVGHQTRHPALVIPDPDPIFWIDEPVARFLRAIGERSSKAEVVNVLLVGPTGTGKSSLPREFAAAWRRPFFTMHCQLITEQGDWWGTKEVSPGRGTYLQRAALVDAVETPGCVVLLDEANRTHPENLNALFGLLDHRRSAWVPYLHREVTVAPGVVFMVTLNEGMDYVGTSPVDKALRDRVANTVRLDYPPKQVEKEILLKRSDIAPESAARLVEFAGVIRNNPKLGITVSTRQLLECAALVREGLSLSDAVLFSVVNAAQEDMDRKALLQALQLTGEVGEAYVERPSFNDD